MSKLRRLPLSRTLISPTQGAYSAKLVCMTAMPLVAVSIALRAPMRPLRGWATLSGGCCQHLLGAPSRPCPYARAAQVQRTVPGACRGCC